MNLQGWRKETFSSVKRALFILLLMEQAPSTMQKPPALAAYLFAMDFTSHLESFCSNEEKGISRTMSEEDH